MAMSAREATIKVSTTPCLCRAAIAASHAYIEISTVLSVCLDMAAPATVLLFLSCRADQSLLQFAATRKNSYNRGAELPVRHDGDMAYFFIPRGGVWLRILRLEMVTAMELSGIVPRSSIQSPSAGRNEIRKPGGSWTRKRTASRSKGSAKRSKSWFLEEGADRVCPS